MVKVCIATNFILIKLAKLCFMGIISMFGTWSFFPLEWAFFRMILKRSRSCDGREHTLLSQPLKQCRESVVNAHLVPYTCGSLRAAWSIEVGQRLLKKKYSTHIVVGAIAIFLLLTWTQRVCEIKAGNIWRYIRWCLNSVGDSPISFQQSLQGS